ncbi:hypothetical protein PRZ48_002660 [Zasmidium cellare]|uniref:NAD(P)-binding protein n=1 Tax=Zasmidium cellare TaxID=395010 RepID=A0ABR0ESV3_ZASCE|nr:hypothetical protein PRZ48_002660 [Zasmidium cellare]
MAPSTEYEFPSFTNTLHRSVYPAISPTNPSNSASGKVVLVTGGGIGVGLGIAKAYVEAGAKTVAILGRRENILADAKKQLESAGSSQILTFKADIVDEAALDKAFASTGPIDIVVANAGYLSEPGPAATAELGDYFKAFEINIKGTLLTFRAFLKHKSSSSTPTFISLNTGAAHNVFPNYSAYSASKIGQGQLIAHLAAENPDVRVVSMHPGVLGTEMNSKSGMTISHDEMSLPAGFAVWLASAKASWVSGKFLWAHWDVEELEALRGEIEGKGLLGLGLLGWPRVEKPVVVV